MTDKILSSDEQINKINELMRLAKLATSSDDLIQRVGAITIDAGIVDALTVQFARVMEQIILKSQLAQNESPKFFPKDESYFFDNQVDSRRIVNYIKKKLLPFKSIDSAEAINAEKANILATALIKKTNEFLNHRNKIVHHAGNPKMSLSDFSGICDKTIQAYDECLKAQKAFFEFIYPYQIRR